jgi:hypothetical protein
VRHAPEEHRAADDERIETTFHCVPGTPFAGPTTYPRVIPDT